jgi:hypothetical protein
MAFKQDVAIAPPVFLFACVNRCRRQAGAERAVRLTPSHLKAFALKAPARSAAREPSPGQRAFVPNKPAQGAARFLCLRL